jgi:hypothetical protein
MSDYADEGIKLARRVKGRSLFEAAVVARIANEKALVLSWSEAREAGWTIKALEQRTGIKQRTILCIENRLRNPESYRGWCLFQLERAIEKVCR